MAKETASTKTLGEIRDFIEEMGMHLKTVDLLNNEIAAYDTNDAEDRNRVSCYILARDLVLDEARRKLQLFDKFLVNETQIAEE